MSNQFYQPSYERGAFDFSDDIYKGEQLDMQRDAMGQKRDAQKRAALGKTPELGKGWSAHGLPIQTAYGIKLKQKISADAAGDIAKSKDLERELMMLKQFTQTDAEYGSRVDAMIKEASGANSNRFTTDSREELSNFYNLQKEALTVNENGDLLFNGKPLSPSNSPFTRIPSLVRNKDSAFLKAINTTEPKDLYTRDANSNIIYNDEVNRDSSKVLAEEFVKSGAITQDEAEEFAQKVYDHRKSKSSYKDDEKYSNNNGGNSPRGKSITETAVGIYYPMPSGGVKIGENTINPQDFEVRNVNGVDKLYITGDMYDSKAKTDLVTKKIKHPDGESTWQARYEQLSDLGTNKSVDQNNEYWEMSQQLSEANTKNKLETNQYSSRFAPVLSQAGFANEQEMINDIKRRRSQSTNSDKEFTGVPEGGF